MEELAAYRVELLGALESVLGELSAVVASQSVESVQQPIKTGSDTPHYVLFHLRELEKQVFSIQLPHFLTEENPIFPAFYDQAWMQQHYRLDEPAEAILEELAMLRHRELAWLQPLPPVAWSRTARHAWWGVHTLQWWVELQLDWSVQHLKQMRDAV